MLDLSKEIASNKIDPYFRVEIDFNVSSADPAKGIWSAQHCCVAEGFALDDPIPAKPAEAIIRHELTRKHWSVLNYGYIGIHIGGFSHDITMQWVRHQDSHFDVEEPTAQYPGVFPLCQSMRYTGDRMMLAAKGEIPIEKVFYYQPVGTYKTRTGTYEITEADRYKYYELARETACQYTRLVEDGKPEDVARRSLASGYRQNFTLAGNLRAVLHALDQRTLADSQYEAQVLAWMVIEKIKEWQPEFMEFYIKERAGKNLLAP
jgi:flavin-dependent thymidylate synthase